MSEANARTALAILGAVAFVVAMFLGALTAPMIPVAFIGLLAGLQTGDAQSIAFLGLLIALLALVLLKLRERWAQILLAVMTGLILGSLAPPVMASAA